MTKQITRKMLHSIIDDSIENGADTLLITSKNDEKIHLVIGHFDTVKCKFLSTKIATELKLVDEVE